MLSMTVSIVFTNLRYRVTYLNSMALISSYLKHSRQRTLPQSEPLFIIQLNHLSDLVQVVAGKSGKPQDGVYIDVSSLTEIVKKLKVLHCDYIHNVSRYKTVNNS